MTLSFNGFPLKREVFLYKNGLWKEELYCSQVILQHELSPFLTSVAVKQNCTSTFFL